MSSPVSSLKKGKKTPLPGVGNRAAPFRGPGQELDEKYLDELLRRSSSRQSSRSDSSMVRSGRSPLPKLNHGHGAAFSPAPNDFELMSGMMSKIAKLELQVQFYAKEIVDKDKKIRILEEKLDLKEKYSTAGDVTGPGKVKDLEAKCDQLQKQVKEMEDFLADYGLIFVGDSTKDDPDDVYEEITDRTNSAMWNPGSSVPSQSKFKIDFDKIAQNVNELNIIAGEGEKTVQRTIKGAKLGTREPIQLTLYANGIFMFNGPFRLYEEPETQRCISDLMDGYFPSELQNRYPDGIPIQFTDKREEVFKDHRNLQHFPGVGQLLGGDFTPSRLVPTNLDKSTITDASRQEESQNPAEKRLRMTSQAPGMQMTVDQFLNKLPSTVLRDGKIIDVRSSVADSIKGGPVKASSVTVVETPSVSEMRENAEEHTKSGQSPRDKLERLQSAGSPVTTLRVKSERGDHTYIVKMRYKETIRDLRRYLDLQRPSESPSYDLVTTFPCKQYEDLEKTLEECGLVPNATVHIRPKSTN